MPSYSDESAQLAVLNESLANQLRNPASSSAAYLPSSALQLPDYTTYSSSSDTRDISESDLADNSRSPLDSSLDSATHNPQSFTSGWFMVGNTGQVSVDYLFDGGAYQGELGIFSLEGLEQFELGSQDFIQEVARRVLSHSTLGNVVISDATEGARFSGAFSWEGDFNNGEYLGVKTVAMNPGDRFGVVLTPNSTFAQLLNDPAAGGLHPLFSLAAANPNSAIQFGQIADVTGNGSTFALEDLALDGTSDRDYNDMVFQIRGAIGTALSIDQLLCPNKDWRGSDMGQALLSYIAPYDDPKISQPIDYHFSQSNQPLIGIIDTGFAANNPAINYSRIILGHDYVNGDDNPLLTPGEGNEHGTHILGIIGATQNNGICIDGINDQAPIWLGRAIGSGKWASSLVEFVDTAKKSGQPHAVVNLSFDLTQKNPDGSVTTRYEFTPQERQALEYARQNGVLIIAAAGNDGGTMSALGQASQEFDNIITVGAINYNDKRADYSSFGYGLDLVAYGGTSNDPVVSTVGSGSDLKHLVEALGPQVPLNYLPSQLFTTGNSASAEAPAEPDEVLPDDEMAANARNTFAEVFGTFDEIDEAELENLTPEERQVYEEATQEIDQLLSEYLGSASQKLALEYVDGYYETQVNALSQFIDAFDENLADTLINAQEILQDAGFSVDIPEETDPSTPLDLGLGTMAGTSVATAEVTGAASQIWAANPGLSYAQVKEILKQTATDLNTPGWDTETGAGKVNLTAAIELAKVTKPETSHPQPLLSPLTWSGEGQLFPGERPVSTAVPSFTGRVMNVGYVSTLGYQRVRSAPSTTASQVGVKYPGEALTFDAYENNGGWYSDPVVGGSSRWYHIAGTNQWIWAGYIDNNPEQAEQERQRQDAIRRSEEAARLAQEALQRAEEEARRAEAELQRIEAEQRRIQEEKRRQQEAFQAVVNGITQKYGDPGLLIGSQISNGVTVYQFEKGQLLAQPDGAFAFYAGHLATAYGSEIVDWGKENAPKVVSKQLFNAVIKTTGIRNFTENALIYGLKNPGSNGFMLPRSVLGLDELKYARAVRGANLLTAAFDVAWTLGEIALEEDPQKKREILIKNGSQTIGSIAGGALGGVLGGAIGTELSLAFPLAAPILIPGGMFVGSMAGSAAGSLVGGVIGDLINNNWDKLPTPLTNAIDNSVKNISINLDEVMAAARKKAEDAKQKAQELAASAKAAYQTAQATVQQAQKAYQTFKQEVQQKATQIVQQSQQKMKEIAQSIAEKVANNPLVQAASKIGNFVASYAKKAVQAVSNIINGAKQFVSNVIETGKQFVNNVIETGKQAYQTVTTFVAEKVEQGKQFVADTYNQATQAVNTVTSTVSNGFNGLKHVFGWG